MVQWFGTEALATLLSAMALGGMTFFSFVVAPLVFKTLEPETAARFMRAAFPAYYRVMAAFTGAAAILAWPGGEALTLALVCAVFLFGLLVLLPRVNRHREGKIVGDAAATAAFTRLHRTSVLLNLAQIVVLFVVFTSLAG